MIGAVRTLIDFARKPPVQRCELCSRAIDDDHDHVLSAKDGGLLCACRACALLLRVDAGQFRRVPRAVQALDGALDGPAWDRLGIPVGLACVVRRSDGTTRAMYPGPLGVVEADIDDEAWHELTRAAPELEGLTPDVEALLVDRTGRASTCLRVSIDVVYALVGLLRRHRTTSSDPVRAFLAELEMGRLPAAPASAGETVP